MNDIPFILSSVATRYTANKMPFETFQKMDFNKDDIVTRDEAKDYVLVTYKKFFNFKNFNTGVGKKKFEAYMKDAGLDFLKDWGSFKEFDSPSNGPRGKKLYIDGTKTEYEVKNGLVSGSEIASVLDEVLIRIDANLWVRDEFDKARSKLAEYQQEITDDDSFEKNCDLFTDNIGQGLKAGLTKEEWQLTYNKNEDDVRLAHLNNLVRFYTEDKLTDCVTFKKILEARNSLAKKNEK